MHKVTPFLLCFLLVLAIASISFASDGQGEQLTITTYYPSPYGVYKTLRLFPFPDCGSVGGCQNGELCTQEGTGNFYICRSSSWELVGGGFWAGSGNNIYNINSGNVGVGTNNPAQKLDVSGTAQMTGFKMTANAGDGKVLTSDASGVGTWRTSAAGTLPANCQGASTLDTDAYGNPFCGTDDGAGGGGGTTGCTSAINSISGGTGIAVTNTGSGCSKSSSIAISSSYSPDPPQGTWCGVSMQCSGGSWASPASCKGASPHSGCPSGYSLINMVNAGCTTQFCVKN